MFIRRNFMFRHLLDPAEDAGGSGGIVIPKLSDLTAPPAGGKREEPPKKEDPPGTKPGDTPPGNAPPTEVPPESDVSDIPISAADPDVKAAPVAKKPEDFAKDRRKAKETKEEAEKRLQELEARAAAAEEKILLFTKEKEQWTTKEKELEGKYGTLSTDFETTKKHAEEVEKKYAESFQPQANPYEDEDFKVANGTFHNELGSRLPLRVQGPTGEAIRVTFSNLMQQPNFPSALQQVMTFYTDSVAKGNQPMIDRAVNLMAGIIGADVKVEGKPETDKTLPATDPVFMEVEKAMHAAMPHFVKRQERGLFVTQNAPRIAQERLTKKTDSLRTNLMSGVLLPLDKATTLLTENPLHSVGLFSAIAAHAPILQTQVKAVVDEFAPALALVSDGLQLPLTDPTREGMQAHQESLNRHRRTLADVMQYAVVGKAAGPLIAQLIRERDAAEARANAAAGNTNPGGGGKAGREDGAKEASNDPSAIPLNTVM